jgi:hypothetical protein
MLFVLSAGNDGALGSSSTQHFTSFVLFSLAKGSAGDGGSLRL